MAVNLISEIVDDRHRYRGLSSAEAETRLKKFGYNFRKKSRKFIWLKRWGRIFSEPMMMLIMATALLYYIIGEKVEATIFILSIVPIGFIQYFQEKRTDTAVALLDSMMVEQCKVFRDGNLITIDIKNLAPGDLVYLTAGDKIPADGYLLNSSGLSIDESLMTGESMPVIKEQVPKDVNLIKNEHSLKQGTMIVQGEGTMLVELTGEKTEYGQLGSLLEKIKKNDTPLQKKINRLVKGVALVAIFTVVVVGGILTYIHGWKEGILSALTMAMSLIPEEFPVVFSVFLIMGVWRMAKKNALVREMTTVETLSSATIICTDKTGTLTEGRMTLQKIYYNGRIFDLKKVLPPENESLYFFTNALLSLEKIATDPIEIEVQRYADSVLNIKTNDFFEQYELLNDSPFDANTKMVHHVWQNKNNKEIGQYSVGAPESIFNASNLSADERLAIVKIYESLAEDGYRVVALARKDNLRGEEIVLSDLKFIGLLAMSDPPRQEISDSIKICQEAGVRVIMVTGDNSLTAHTIASQIKLKHNDKIITGAELDKISPSALKRIVATHDIFARVRPEHKYLIVEALQNNGEVVAMTGDGVNDALALRKADIGIAMGLRGTEVARAAAGMVLTDDNFSTIVQAIREGRRIYYNLQQAFVFLLSFHLPIIGLAILPSLFGQPLMFLPIHIIFLELICDPASVLGFEKERPARNIMKEPPRPANEPLINPRLWKQIIIQAVSIFLVSFGFYYYFGFRLNDLELGRTWAFGALIVSQTLLIILTREWQQIKSNRWLLGIAFLTLVGLTLILFVPVLRNVFHLVPISWPMYGIMSGVALFMMLFTSLFVIKRRHI
ncbi:MAG: hypothetical protein COU29_03855 [Candidatus Magasanikbacteria bacterium CG10_big_fil_rev_8_21_14_0_10_36_32]|uniref:ATPase n=1 Tax=Candidatus Magasanikbacteria bacterium CG10_big_fil_rev_8_21_14_0_10_36_32 TaxID=1974646 RepID=A0A2M6W5N2_9BACT|nr:MAG: hypothetical protein COU29_03855 [Candidatus Magasanikbacteria bacterium CG10_big_fil_rev_8_21_14_0_10_36_32]